MTQNNKEIVKTFISCAAFLSSVVIGFIALFIPPEGEIDSSVLWFIAQMLLFVSALLGVNLSLDNIGLKGITNVTSDKINDTKIVNHDTSNEINDTQDETDVTSDEIQKIRIGRR